MQNKDEIKLNYLNNSMQFSQKIFNKNLLQADYNISNENEKGNNSKIIKLNNFNKNFNKSNIFDKKNDKIVVNYNCSKINSNNISLKKNFPDYITKTPYVQKNNKSMEKSINNKTKKIINPEKNLNYSLNGKIIPYSSHVKEIKDLKYKLKKFKKTDSKDKINIKNKNNRINRNLNLTLTEFISIGGTELKKNSNDNILINNNLNKTPEILIKRKYTNTTKNNKLNKKIYGRMNINNLKSNINDTNSNLMNNKSNSNNIIQSDVKRKINKKINGLSCSNDTSSLKNRNYSTNKKFDKIKNNLNNEINIINNNFNKNTNISDKDNIKKYQLIFDIIQNSFFKFIALLENPKEKEIAYNIIQKLNDFFKKQEIAVNNIIKKNGELNDKIKKYKETNKNIEKENSLLKDKCDYLNKKIEDMENEYNNNLVENISHNESFNNNIYPNPFNESIAIENEEEESSVNTEELESIRFFDKIIMKKHSFSKANIPELEIKKIKLNDNEFDYKEKIKINNKKNIINIKSKKFRNNNKYELKKFGKKNTKDFGYTKIEEDKKKININKFRKFK